MPGAEPWGSRVKYFGLVSGHRRFIIENLYLKQLN